MFVSGDTPIQYFYFDMDNNRFHDTQQELTKDKPKGALLRAVATIPKVLIACGNRHFTEFEACRKANKALRDKQ